MKLDGTIPIHASAQAVWDVVVDPIRLASCMPGVQDIRQIDERTFEGTILASVGPIDGSFAFRSILTTARFPDDIVIAVTGADSVTKSRVEMDVQASVIERDSTQAELAYHADVRVKGRLAILGEMVLRATAGLMIGEITQCLRSQVETVSRGSRAAGSGDGVEIDAVEPGIE